MNISYEGSLTSGIIKQLPRIARASITEHRELGRLVESLGIDAVISDNRFGLFSSRMPCIYVSHQLSIVMPTTLAWAQSAVARMNTILIHRFRECWVPDFATEENLSGDLAHNLPLPRNTYFVGPLSRFKKYRDIARQYDVIVVLSGPEPQRTVFEHMLVEQIRTTTLKALIVRGVTETKTTTPITDTITMVSYLTSDDLNRAILSSAVVVSRPGYSTIMDLAVLGTKAVFIPTPGQTEQEYLAARFHDRKIYYSERQSEFRLVRALDAVGDYTGMRQHPPEATNLPERVKHLLTSLLD